MIRKSQISEQKKRLQLKGKMNLKAYQSTFLKYLICIFTNNIDIFQENLLIFLCLIFVKISLYDL